jgi:predicted XRE-type DNA-binding protein
MAPSIAAERQMFAVHTAKTFTTGTVRTLSFRTIVISVQTGSIRPGVPAFGQPGRKSQQCAHDHSPCAHRATKTRPGTATARVAERVTELRKEHQLVSSLGELRRATALTQTDVARNWGRSQSRVSSIEAAEIASIEIGTLVDYARAPNCHVEIRVTVADHTYIEQLA